MFKYLMYALAALSIGAFIIQGARGLLSGLKEDPVDVISGSLAIAFGIVVLWAIAGGHSVPVEYN